MENVYVARQPIFDKAENIHAHERLFRDGTANYVPDIDGDVATTTLKLNSAALPPLYLQACQWSDMAAKVS